MDQIRREQNQILQKNPTVQQNINQIKKLAKANYYVHCIEANSKTNQNISCVREWSVL
ncbi:hypothetical protein LLO_2676 [Legionella longbeachae NSW150]|uniref:Uncharacterized protein n=1 Tax=Legionella longbeachae serogroup 1 (strain NSW150) TaxID=661367 RepID=D3HKY7_LEGLN|nr:hypothetical protein LLB_2655 [Legionella longbeachae D-4968]CBJ13105.1 hypothetical protein LLO_2676 [Legionella longbeachae NSW150]